MVLMISLYLHLTHSMYIHQTVLVRIVSPPFDESGFFIWRKNMLTALCAKNKLGLITSRIPKLEFDSPYYSFWERCNDMVIAWITNSLSNDIANSVMCFDTAKDIWADINLGHQMVQSTFNYKGKSVLLPKGL